MDYFASDLHIGDKNIIQYYFAKREIRGHEIVNENNEK